MSKNVINYFEPEQRERLDRAVYEAVGRFNDTEGGFENTYNFLEVLNRHGFVIVENQR